MSIGRRRFGAGAGTRDHDDEFVGFSRTHHASVLQVGATGSHPTPLHAENRANILKSQASVDISLVAAFVALSIGRWGEQENETELDKPTRSCILY